MASCGLEFASSPIGDVIGPVDTLMVAGGTGMDIATADEELLHHVRRLAVDARRVTSVCSGAFVLAAAGLLEGRRATTHWDACGLLERPLRGCHRRRRRHLRPRRQRVDLGRSHRRHRPRAGTRRRRPRTRCCRHGRPATRRLPPEVGGTGPVLQPSGRAGRRHRTGDATCCPGCATTSPTTCPWPPSLASSTCPNDSSAGSSSPRSASPPRTTWKPSDSSQRAGCWRPRTGRSSRSPGPAVSAPPRP